MQSWQREEAETIAMKRLILRVTNMYMLESYSLVAIYLRQLFVALVVMSWSATLSSCLFEDQQVPELDWDNQNVPVSGRLSAAKLSLVANYLTVVLEQQIITLGEQSPGIVGELARTQIPTHTAADIRDLNNDILPDVVLTSYANNSVIAFVGLRGGGFDEAVTLPLTGHGSQVKVEDMNNDSKMDIVATSTGSGQKVTIHLYLNKQNFEYRLAKVQPTLLDTDRSLQIISMNYDVYPDIFIRTSFPEIGILAYQSEQEAFETQYWPKKFQFPFTSAYCIGHFDDDAQLDLIANYSGFDFDYASLHKGTSSGLFSDDAVKLDLAGPTASLEAIDLNLDGLDDLIGAEYRTSDISLTNRLFCYYSSGNFTFHPPIIIPMEADLINFIVDGQYVICALKNGSLSVQKMPKI